MQEEYKCKTMENALLIKTENMGFRDAEIKVSTGVQNP